MEEDTALRTEFRKAGVEYAVIKNTMIDLAVKDTPYAAQMEEHLKGPTAVAFGYTDMIAPAKIAVEFGKKSKKLTLKCGVCDGAFLDAAGVQALAELPSKEVLLVLDATTGKNAVSQAKEFGDVADITGIVLTKMDGTAKGGIAITVADEFDMPVKFIGVGEGIEDLMAFDPAWFIGGIFDE